MNVRPRDVHGEKLVPAPLDGGGGGGDLDFVDLHGLGDHLHRHLVIGPGVGRALGVDGEGGGGFPCAHGEEAAGADAAGVAPVYVPGHILGRALHRGGKLFRRSLLYHGFIRLDVHGPGPLRAFVQAYPLVGDQLTAGIAVHVFRSLPVHLDGGVRVRREALCIGVDVEAEIILSAIRQRFVAVVQRRKPLSVAVGVQIVFVPVAQAGPGAVSGCLVPNVPVVAVCEVAGSGHLQSVVQAVGHLRSREPGGGEGLARVVEYVQRFDDVPVRQDCPGQQTQGQQEDEGQAEKPFRSFHVRSPFR